MGLCASTTKPPVEKTVETNVETPVANPIAITTTTTSENNKNNNGGDDSSASSSDDDDEDEVLEEDWLETPDTTPVDDTHSSWTGGTAEPTAQSLLTKKSSYIGTFPSKFPFLISIPASHNLYNILVYSKLYIILTLSLSILLQYYYFLNPIYRQRIF